MEYCYLGDLGLQVSRLGLGTIPFGSTLSIEDSARMVDMFDQAGGNFLDTANVYGTTTREEHNQKVGTAERTLGEILKGRRDRFIIATKGCWQMEVPLRPNGFGLSRTYLSKNIDASLKRLKTDYIDLYQCHCIDPYTPIEETMRVLDDFVRVGKIRYIGVSNWDGWQVARAVDYANTMGLTPLISNQIWYNLADRVAEFSIIPACRDRKVSIIAWGALASGFLTGKYNRGDAQPPGRFDVLKDTEMCSWKMLTVERNFKTIDQLRQIATEINQPVSAVALRWLLQVGTCDVVLVGASRLQQMQKNLSTLSFELSEQQMESLLKTSELTHPYPHSFWEQFCYHDSPFYGGAR